MMLARPHAVPRFGRRRCAALIGASLSLVAGALVPSAAQGRLVQVVAQDGDLRIFDPLAASALALASEAPTLPAGVNTSAIESGVSMSASGRLVGFARAGGAEFPRTFLVADRTAGTVTTLTTPAPTDPTARPRQFALSPNGRLGAFLYDSGSAARTEAVVVDLTGLPSSLAPEVARYAIANGFTDQGKDVIDAHLADDGRVVWSSSFRQNQAFSFGAAWAGPSQPPTDLAAQTFPLVLKRTMQTVPGFGGTIIGVARQREFQAPPRFTLVAESTATPSLSALALPNVDLLAGTASETLLSSAGDGRYLSWVSTAADGVQRVLVYDTKTQGLVDATGRRIDGGVPESAALGEVAEPVIKSFAAPTVLSPSVTAPVLRTSLRRTALVGIIIHRVRGTVALGPRRVQRLRLVGRVPLGTRGKGGNRLRWNGRVNGKRLPAGTYRVTLRVLERGRAVELSQPRTMRVRLSAA